MPDLQSELSKLANAWDNNTHEETNQQPKEEAMETSEAVHTYTYNGRNRIRDMFNDIKSNPGITKAQAIVNAMNAGGAESTAITNVNLLVRSGLVKFDGKGLTAYYPEYDAMRITKLHAANKGKRGAMRRKQIEIVRRPAPAKEEAKGLADLLREKFGAIPTIPNDAIANTYIQPVTQTFNAEKFINQQLTIAQAKEVYNYLKSVFGN